MGFTFPHIGAARWTISILYTAVIAFLLMERLMADYYFHCAKDFALPLGQLRPFLTWVFPITIVLLLVSFLLGANPSRPGDAVESVNLGTEIALTAVVIYLAYVLGLFKGMPFREFLLNLSIFVVLTGALMWGYNLALKMLWPEAVVPFRDWAVASAIVTLVCLGFFRAVRTEIPAAYPGTSSASVLDSFIYWKDIVIYTLFGVIVLQGFLRIVSVLEGSSSVAAAAAGHRVAIFMAYFVIVLSAALVFGIGDMLFLSGKTFQAYKAHQQEAVTRHVYIRDLVLLAVLLVNSIGLFFKLFIRYPTLKAGG